jgi:hypothetical protein
MNLEANPPEKERAPIGFSEKQYLSVSLPLLEPAVFATLSQGRDPSILDLIKFAIYAIVFR